MTANGRLNPYLPDPQRTYSDERTARTVAVADEASRMDYDPKDSRARDRRWGEALDLARTAAKEPAPDTPEEEITFSIQLALRSAMLAQDYAAAAEMLDLLKARTPREEAP